MDENFWKHLDNMLQRSVQLDYDHGEVQRWIQEKNKTKNQIKIDCFSLF